MSIAISRILPSSPAQPTSITGVAFNLVPGDVSLSFEVQRTTDSVGSPNVGAALTIGQCGPFGKAGGVFIDIRPSNGSLWWYRARHVGTTVDPGPYTSWISSTAYAIRNEIYQAWLTGASIYPLVRGEPWNDLGFAVSASASDGATISAAVKDSSGTRAINKFLSKTLIGDPDTLDGTPEGTSFKRTIASRVSSGKPLIDFGENLNIREETISMRQGPVSSPQQVNNFLTNGGALAQWFAAQGIAFGTIEWDVLTNGGIVDVLLWDSGTTGGPNGYIFRFDGRSGQSSGQILRVTNGTWSSVGTAKTAYNPVNASALSGWHRVKVKAIGGGSIGQYDLYVDGKWSWTLTDNTYACNAGLLYIGCEISSEQVISPSSDTSANMFKVTTKVGGNNEVPNSSFENGLSGPGWNLYNNGPEAATLTISTTAPYHGFRHAHVAWTVQNTSQKGVFISAALVGYNRDLWYTLSWYAKASAGQSGGMQLNWNHPPDAQQTIFNPNLTTTYQRYAFRFRWVTGGGVLDNAFFISILSGLGNNISMDIDAIQLEQAEVPTAYSPKGDELYTTDLGLIATVMDSSGTRAVNKFLAKAVSGDPDSLDGTPDGTTYIRPRRIISSVSTAPAQALYQAFNGSTTSASEVSLGSYSLPGGTLSTTSDTLRITCIASVLNASDHFTVKFGSTTLFTGGLTVGLYLLTIYLTRTGASAESVNAVNIPPSGVPNLGAVTSAAETLSGALTIDFRAQSVSGNAVKIITSLVEFLGV